MNTEQNYVSAGSIATDQPQTGPTSSSNQTSSVEQLQGPAPAIRRPFKTYLDMQFDLQPVNEHFETSDAGVVVEALQAYRNAHWQELKEILEDFAECGLSEKRVSRLVQDISEGHIQLLFTIIDRCTDNIDAMTQQMDVARYYHYHRNL